MSTPTTPSTANALWSSLVRTFVPIIVGAVIAFFVSHGINLDPSFELLLTTALTAGFGFVYYLAARLLETYVTPKLGWLLGLAKAPAYTPPATGTIGVDTGIPTPPTPGE